MLCFFYFQMIIKRKNEQTFFFLVGLVVCSLFQDIDGWSCAPRCSNLKRLKSGGYKADLQDSLTLLIH